MKNTLEKFLAPELNAELEALSMSQAVIRFDPQGNILEANQNFLDAMGYKLEEIIGKHHSIFVDPEYRESEEYKNFWAELAQGQFKTEQFKRYTKTGEEIWIQASYNPIINSNGKTVKVVKYATDITKEVEKNADYQGKINAINRSQAVIEFTPEGKILTANDNFLKTVGYTLEEIQGQHHKIFCDEKLVSSSEYSQFWSSLAKGIYSSGEFKRYRKGGKEIWIHASYNPIFNANGKVFKVVKYASDITEKQKKNLDYEGQISAISKSQAVIEFNMDGTIINANENFLTTVGYSLSDIKGRHHSMFVDPEYRASEEYARFWDDLRQGKYKAGEFKRFGNNEKEVWIQASYNPILDMNGKPFKVVKYATDITARVLIQKKVTDYVEDSGNSSIELTQYIATVASAAEELATSIGEITNNTNTAADMTKKAVSTISLTNEIIRSLKTRSAEIGEIAKVVGEIASQTNLLALNATIEAARAGEAGKGFAVVAHEVKDLASKTTEATERINQNIISIQEEVERSLISMGDATSSIEEIDSVTTSIASSMEEQNSVTSEIGDSMQNANKKVNKVSENISSIKVTVEQL